MDIETVHQWGDEMKLLEIKVSIKQNQTLLPKGVKKLNMSFKQPDTVKPDHPQSLYKLRIQNSLNIIAETLRQHMNDKH